MKDKIPYIGFGIMTVMCICLAVYIKLYPQKETIYHTDTLTVERYNEAVKDTVIKWYEKIIYKEVKPEIIYVEKVDSVFIENVKYKDLMLRIEKKRNSLKIYAVNLNDSLLKEYNYADVGNEWTATSITGNVFVKSKRITWNGFKPYLAYNQPINNLKDWNFNNIEFGIKTGVSIKRLQFNIGVGFDAYRKTGIIKLESDYSF